MTPPCPTAHFSTSPFCAQSNKNGSVCTFTCNDGYYMSGAVPSADGRYARTCSASTSVMFDGEDVVCRKCPVGK